MLGPQFLLLSTQGGVRAPDGRPVALGYHTGHWEVGLLVQAAARRIKALKERCRSARIPTLYVNDNFGRWQSDFAKLVAHCREPASRGREVMEQLVPDEEKDYFVLKPKHSGFFSTTLDTLLEYLEAKTLILTGLTADICVLFTANDAYMRDFNLIVPSDCVASQEPDENRHALEHMRRVLKADIRPSTELDLGKIAAGARENRGRVPAGESSGALFPKDRK
jgi:nicotinamidase-related amidase